MGAMYKLKAYFGMVPAEEMEIDEERFAVARRSSRGAGWEDRWDDERSDDDRVDRRSSERDDHWSEGDRWDAERRDTGARERRDTDRWDGDRGGEDLPRERRGSRSLPPPVRSVAGPAPVRGALAIDPQAVASPLSSPVQAVSSAPPEQRERATGAAALARITTLQPRSYNEARAIGERYREGVPVIMNLTELDDAAAKRLVDFAAGLVFALRGGFDKVTNRVFLLTPADVEVSADDARKLVGRVGTDRARPPGL